MSSQRPSEDQKQAEDELVRRRRQSQEQQQPSLSFAGHNHLHAGGIPPPHQMPPQQQQMMMAPDRLRYLQEMRRAEELMMASQGGGGGPPQGRTTASRTNAFPGGHQWPGAAASFPREGGRPPNMPSQQDRSSPSDGGGDPSVARMPPPPQQDHDPAMLLSLLQQEQERLLNLLRQQGNVPESWPPPAKRSRLPTSNVPYNASRNTDPQIAQSQARIPMPAGFPNAGSEQPPTKRRRHIKSFPMKLMEAINEYYDEQVVAWLPDGKSFVVVDQDRFVDNVLLDAFKGGKYTSFIRKLNRWGFRRLTSNSGVDCFHSPLFLRDRPELCDLMTSSAERDDTVGVNPQLLGRRPSLAGLETFLENKAKGTQQSKETARGSDTKVDASEEEKSSPRKPGED